MTVQASFQPKYGSGQAVVPAVAAATVSIDGASKSVFFYNSGANPCSVRIGKLSAAGVLPTAATIADMLIPAGKSMVISKMTDDDGLSTISALGTTLFVICGEGGPGSYA